MYACGKFSYSIYQNMHLILISRNCLHNELEKQFAKDLLLSAQFEQITHQNSFKKNPSKRQLDFHFNMLHQRLTNSSNITNIMFLQFWISTIMRRKPLQVTIFTNISRQFIQNSLLVKLCLKCGYQYVTLINICTCTFLHNYNYIYAILAKTIPQHTGNFS